MVGTLAGGAAQRIVMEYCSGGTLSKHTRTLTFAQAHWVLEQVLNALVYLDAKGIVHDHHVTVAVSGRA